MWHIYCVCFNIKTDEWVSSPVRICIKAPRTLKLRSCRFFSFSNFLKVKFLSNLFAAAISLWHFWVSFNIKSLFHDIMLPLFSVFIFKTHSI